jgi:putative acyl-CoA dehydrogenase
MAPATHQVTNQPPPFVGHSAWADDPLLRAAVAREGGGWVDDRARALGELLGGERLQVLAHTANRHPPTLHTHDRFGHRIDQVEFHPAWHELMQEAFGRGLHSLAWTAGRDGAFVARAALNYLWNQNEQGTSCPVTMTFAAVRVLRVAPELAAVWEPSIVAEAHDPRPLPRAAKRAVTVGMAMTEKQGGSDLRAITTEARSAGPGVFRLRGHKWFCSAPMSDAFLTLARTDKGVGCYLVPRTLDDGTRNPILIQRLKDKCGNRSNASSEIEFDDTLAWPVGEEGRGIPTLIEMAHYTRFDIVVAAAGMMRGQLALALHHTIHRSAFGRPLLRQPLMRNVLADLALECEAHTAVAFRLARAFDRQATDPREAGIARLLTPIAKYWACKRLPVFAAEAMECLGGNGYVEDGPMARLYREAPLNGIWEGSGNVACLDVLRAIGKEPAAWSTLYEELASGATNDARLMKHLARMQALLSNPATTEVNARRIVEGLAIAAQAVVLLRTAPSGVAEVFCAARLGGERGAAFGTLPVSAPLDELLTRAGASA